jgi:hypothetical protein
LIIKVVKYKKYKKYKIGALGVNKLEITNNNKKRTKNNICPELGLNQRPSAFQADALPLSYPNLRYFKKIIKNN